MQRGVSVSDRHRRTATRGLDRPGADRRWFPALPAGALFVLVCACGGSDSLGREAVIRRLEADPTEKNLLDIRSYTHDLDHDVRAAALQALVALDVPDAPRLIGDGLADPDGFVRATAVRFVADRRDAEFTVELVGLLAADPDTGVRSNVAQALAQLGGPEAAAGLTRALADPSDRVRRAAVDGLGVLGAAPAREPLARLLAEDPVWEVRADAARVLGATGDPEVVPALEAALADPNEFVRAAAIHALRVRTKKAQGAE